MTKEDKQLLLKDLCARLPYGVKVQVTQVPIGLSKDETLTYNRMYSLDESDEYITVKPYLRPMSSMTDEEIYEFEEFVFPSGEDENGDYQSGVLEKDVPDYIDWLFAHHFDYCGLIERGLAIEAPEGMYNKNKITCYMCEDKQYCSQSEYVKKNCYKLK